MPRGVYARKSAQQKPAAKAKPQPVAKAPDVVPAASAPAEPPVQPASELAQRQFSREDFRRSVDDMSGELLKAYARRIGITQRDVERLTEDRLRQNCKAFLVEQLEA